MPLSVERTHKHLSSRWGGGTINSTEKAEKKKNKQNKKGDDLSALTKQHV